jgi:hypothetical protein
MRTLTTQQTATLQCRAGYLVRGRVRVLRSGTWHDLTSLFGRDFLDEATVSEALDAPVATATVRLLREVNGLSCAPLVTDSAVNLVAGVYSALLKEGRTFTVEAAVVPLGMEPESGDWVEIFRGRIDEPDAGGDTVSFTGRDSAGLLQDTLIEDEVQYGSGAGVAVQTVMQSILNDNGLSAFTLYTPTSPAWLLGPYLQRSEPVMDALATLARQLGWEVRWKWRSSAAAFQLTFWSPDRSSTTPAWSFTPEEYQQLGKVSTPLTDVRNAVEVVYSDRADLDVAGNPKRKTALREDATSIAAYGRRFSRIAEGASSNINTLSEAERFGDAFLADLKDAPLGLELEVQLHPFLELGDLVEVEGNGVHFSADQTGAVQALTHTMGSSGCTTRLTLKGKPSLGRLRWLQLEQRPGVAPPSPFTGPGAPVGVTATATTQGVKVAFAGPSTGPVAASYELHLSTSSGFTPDATTLRATSSTTAFSEQTLQAGSTYYVKVVPRDVKGNRGTASSEVSVTAAYLRPGGLQPRVTYAALPLNADFESWPGAAAPPDAFQLSPGTWGTDATREITTVYSGSYAVKLEATAVAARVESDFILCRPGELIVPTAVFRGGLQTYASGYDVSLYVNYYDANFTYLRTDTLATRDTSAAAWLIVGGSQQSIPAFDVRYFKIVCGKTNATAYATIIDSMRCYVFPGPPEESTLSLANSWVNATASPATASYYRDFAKRVHLQGAVKDGMVGANLLSTPLPAGYRPMATRQFLVAGGAAGLTATVEVYTTGHIIVVNGSNTYVSLDGISFRAD